MALPSAFHRRAGSLIALASQLLHALISGSLFQRGTRVCSRAKKSPSSYSGPCGLPQHPRESDELEELSVQSLPLAASPPPPPPLGRRQARQVQCEAPLYCCAVTVPPGVTHDVMGLPNEGTLLFWPLLHKQAASCNMLPRRRDRPHGCHLACRLPAGANFTLVYSPASNSTAAIGKSMK